MHEHEVGAPGHRQAADAHGRAALLLVESLIHELLARSLLPIDEAIAMVESAADVSREMAFEYGDTAVTRQSSALLDAISASLRHDSA